MKRKSFLLLIIIFSILIINLSKYVEGYYLIPLNFETDKTTYYNDESINITLKYDMMYDTQDETSYIQIWIESSNDTRLWTSSQYSELGVIEKNWIIRIQDLNLSYENFSNYLYIRIYHYNYHDLKGLQFEGVIREIQIETIKRNVSCELIDFDNHIKYGENLHFGARFYNTSIGSNSYLINQSTLLKIISNDIILYSNNFTTNSSGIINIFISSNNLTLGLNYVIFIIEDNPLFNASNFKYELFVESSIIQETDSKEKVKKTNESFQIKIMSLISIIGVSLLIGFLIYFNNIKRTKQQKLADLTFRF